MKKLELNQMENLNAGAACHDRLYGAGVGIMVGSAIGGPVAFLGGATIGLLVMMASVGCGKY